MEKLLIVLGVLLSLAVVPITGCWEEDNDRECRDDWQCRDDEKCDSIYGDCIPKTDEEIRRDNGECESDWDCPYREDYNESCVDYQCVYEEDIRGDKGCCEVLRYYECSDGPPPSLVNSFDSTECRSGRLEYFTREGQEQCPSEGGIPEFDPYASRCACVPLAGQPPGSRCW
jgi:hypothetical protein